MPVIVPNPAGPSAADIRESLIIERERGRRLHEELSNNLTSVQQQMAEQQAQVQRAQASEAVAWNAQMKSEVRAGEAEALAFAAAQVKKTKKEKES